MSRGFNEDKLAIAGEIRLKLQEGRQRGAGFMLRLENTDTQEHLYVFLPPRTPPRQGFQQYCDRHGHNFNPLECYDFEEDLENQVLADSTQNWDRTLPVQTGPFSGVVPYQGEGPNMPDQDPDDQR